MKTLIPTFILLACLFTACNKSDYADVQAGDQFRVVGTNQFASSSIKGAVIGVNAFTVNGSIFSVSAIGYTYGLASQTSFSSQQGATLICTTKFPLPFADGTYTFNFSNDLKKSTNMKVTLVMVDQGMTYDLAQTVESVATLQVAQGRFALNIPEILLVARDGSDNYVHLSGSLSSVSSSQGPVVNGPISNPRGGSSGSNTDGDPKL
jgi:hypothetical protein